MEENDVEEKDRIERLKRDRYMRHPRSAKSSHSLGRPSLTKQQRVITIFLAYRFVSGGSVKEEECPMEGSGFVARYS